MSGCPVTGEPICRCTTRWAKRSDIGIRDTLRKLFTDHAVYTRMFLTSYLNRNPDLSAIQTRLLQNQTDIGSYIGRKTNSVVGKKLGDLLTSHIKLAANVIQTYMTRTQNPNEYSEEVRKLFANSDQIAEFLSTLCANCMYTELKVHFDQHNQYILDMVQKYSKNDYQESVQIYDAYLVHMLGFADTIARGL
jgi:hypothetical protein